MANFGNYYTSFSGPNDAVDNTYGVPQDRWLAAQIDAGALDRESKEKMFYDELDFTKESWEKQFESTEARWDDQLAQWEREFGLKQRELSIQEDQFGATMGLKNTEMRLENSYKTGMLGMKAGELDLSRQLGLSDLGLKQSRFEWEKNELPRTRDFLKELYTLKNKSSGTPGVASGEETSSGSSYANYSYAGSDPFGSDVAGSYDRGGFIPTDYWSSPYGGLDEAYADYFD